MSVQHTPGPFFAEPAPSSTFVTRAIYARRLNGSDVLVAHVGIPGSEASRATVFEDVANAYLFAAAPEMLAAGKALYDAIGRVPHGEPIFTSEVVKAGEDWCAAFRKALGEEA